MWTLGDPTLASGDRVRANGRLGFVGWHNDEKARVQFGTEQGYTKRLYCGRNVGARALGGGNEGDGRCGPDKGPACASCRRFLEANQSLLGDESRNVNLLQVEC